MLEHLRRALDLALRYDYEYWLQRELTNNLICLQRKRPRKCFRLTCVLSWPPPGKKFRSRPWRRKS